MYVVSLINILQNVLLHIWREKYTYMSRYTYIKYAHMKKILKEMSTVMLTIRGISLLRV